MYLMSHCFKTYTHFTHSKHDSGFSLHVNVVNVDTCSHTVYQTALNMSPTPCLNQAGTPCCLENLNSFVHIFSQTKQNQVAHKKIQVTINPDGPPLLVAGCQLLDVLFFRQSRKGSLLLSEKGENEQESLELVVGPSDSAFVCHFWGDDGCL